MLLEMPAYHHGLSLLQLHRVVVHLHSELPEVGELFVLLHGFISARYVECWQILGQIWGADQCVGFIALEVVKKPVEGVVMGIPIHRAPWKPWKHQSNETKARLQFSTIQFNIVAHCIEEHSYLNIMQTQHWSFLPSSHEQVIVENIPIGTSCKTIWAMGNETGKQHSCQVLQLN